MSFVRVKPSGYALGDQVTSPEFNQLDTDHTNALDKTSAGDTLSGVIQVASGGQLFLNHGGQVFANAAGAVIAATSGAIVSGAIGGINLTGGPNDYETFTPPRSRSLAVPPIIQALTSGWSVLTGAGAGIGLQGSAGTTPINLLLPTVHNGATLASVTVSLAVAGAHSGVPQNMPSIQVSVINLLTGANTSFGSNSIPIPGSGAAWHNGGAQQAFTLALNPFSVVDNTQNVYVLNLTDENGANAVAGNVFAGFVLNFTNIADMRFST